MIAGFLERHVQGEQHRAERTSGSAEPRPHALPARGRRLPRALRRRRRVPGVARTQDFSAPGSRRRG